MSNILGTDGVCTYCGEPADSVDHVISLDWLGYKRGNGKSKRAGMVVWACRDCNSRLRNKNHQTLTARCEDTCEIIFKSNKKLIDGPLWGNGDIDGLEGNLRCEMEVYQAHQIIARARYSFYNSPKFWLNIEAIRNQVRQRKEKAVWADSFFETAA